MGEKFPNGSNLSQKNCYFESFLKAVAMYKNSSAPEHAQNTGKSPETVKNLMQV